MKAYKALAAAAMVAAVATPFVAGAQNVPTSITAITSYIQNRVVGWLTGLFWALTAVFILWAAFLYLTGAGNDDKIGKAKQILIYAVIAGIVALFAQVGLRPLITSLFP